MKKLAILSVLLCLTIGLSAQSKWKGFGTPMTKYRLSSMYDDFHEKALVGKALIRPAMSANFLAVKPMFDENWNFTQFDLQVVQRAGFGLSYCFYESLEGEGVAYEKYSIDLLLTIVKQSEVQGMNSGVLLTFSAFDLWNLKPSFGAGIDIVKDTPFKSWWYGAFNVRYSF